ncbi:hypothetical protein BGZ94_005751, partial [Podila epigama]
LFEGDGDAELLKARASELRSITPQLPDWQKDEILRYTSIQCIHDTLLEGIMHYLTPVDCIDKQS